VCAGGTNITILFCLAHSIISTAYKAAFRKIGIYSYNPSAISEECVQPSEIYIDSVSTSVNSVEKNNVVTIETKFMTFRIVHFLKWSKARNI
jgi:hypothetical protein